MTKTERPKAVSHPRLRDALKQLQPEMDRLRDQRLPRVNLDPIAAVAVARGALPRLMPLREALAKELNSFDLRNLDQLELYASALLQAHTVWLGINARSEALSRLAKEGYELRALMATEVTLLAKRGQIPKSRLAGLKGPNGHCNIASDLLMLTGLVRQAWPRIADSTSITVQELDRAEVLGDELIEAIGLRNQVTEEARQATLQRHCAFYLFWRAYDQIRRAVTFLRWNEGDADRVAPSLYRKHGRRRAAPADALGTEASPRTDPEGQWATAYTKYVLVVVAARSRKRTTGHSDQTLADLLRSRLLARSLEQFSSHGRPPVGARY